MNRAFEKGTLTLDFPLPPFGSPVGLLGRALSAYAGNFIFIASVTLLIFLPAKFAIQIMCELFDISTKSMLMYLLLSASDLVLTALVTPAVIYGLVGRMRKGTLPPFGESLQWGMRQWGRMLWNRIKVDVTVSLSMLLLIVPGILAAIRLAFTEIVVSIEGDLCSAPLDRSRNLADGHRWRIFFVMLPLAVVEIAGSYFILKAFTDPSHSRTTIAVVDSLLSVGGQITSVVALLMYLGVRKQK